jgi:sugar (pentulose or hexulose) kinase
MTRALWVDVGASGVRAAIVDATNSVVAYAAESFAPAGARDPSAWAGAVEAAVA